MYFTAGDLLERRTRNHSVDHLTQFNFSFIIRDPRGGYSQKNWIGVCGSLPKTPTLFKTKICDIPYPIYDLTKTS